jgi:hypothetical protein
VEPDEAHIALGRSVNAAAKGAVERLGLDRAWL